MSAASGSVFPSGDQHQLVHGELRATVVEVGGGLRELVLGERPLLAGYSVEEMCPGAKGQSLLPWPNRVDRGRYGFRGTEHQLPLTEPDAANAIHGLTRWLSWRVVERAADQIVLGLRLHPQPGYPWPLDLRIDYRLDDAGLTVQTTAANPGDQACPFAAGAHPYLTVGTPTVDGAELQLRAGAYLPTDDRGMPTGTEPVAGTPYDFNQPHPVGGTEIDHAFVDLARDAAGRSRVVLADPEHDVRVSLWADQAYPYLELFTADTLSRPHRRTGLGVEPMTAPPNAFGTGEHVVVLEPGGSWTGSWGITAG